ncbi:MAG: PAS domain S-box protein [Thermodesulfobacteriota bacterium]
MVFCGQAIATAHGQTVAGVADVKPQPFRIVYFNSYHQGYKWSDDLRKGIRDSFETADFDRPISFFVEYMDTKRVAGEAYMTQLYRTYKEKYSDIDVDLILSSDDNAFDFLQKYRADLFGATPYIFCGVNYLAPDRLENTRNIAGVNETAGIRETLSLIFELHPATEKILVINDGTKTGVKVHGRIVKESRLWQDRAEFVFTDGLALPAILDKVRALDDNSIILYTFFFRNPDGRFFDNKEVISRVEAASPVPIYSTWDFNLGFGVVGGMLASGYYQGKKAAEMAGRVIAGNDINDIGVIMKSPNRYFFDYEMLQKHDIALSNLPRDRIVINRPPTLLNLYQDNRTVVFGSLLVFLSTVVILLLAGGVKIRRANRRVRFSEQKYRTIFEYTGTAMITIAPDTTITMVNSQFEKLFGYGREEVENRKSWHAFVHEADTAQMQSFHQQRRAGKNDVPNHYEFRFVNRYNEQRHIFITVGMIPETSESVASLIDVTDRIVAEKEQKRLIAELQDALNNLKLLRGLLPICSHCKKIRDDTGYWNRLEAYIEKHSDAEFSHSICPDCARRHYPDLEIYDENGCCGGS